MLRYLITEHPGKETVHVVCMLVTDGDDPTVAHVCSANCAPDAVSRVRSQMEASLADLGIEASWPSESEV